MKNIYNSIEKFYNNMAFAELSLEWMTFFSLAVAGIFMAAVGIIGNLSLGLGPITIIIPSINIVLDTCCIFYSIKTREWFVPSVIAVFYGIFVLFPFLWFSTGGATGSTMPFIIMAGLAIAIMYKGKLRNFLLIMTPLLFAFFIFLEWYNPDIYIPYPSRDAHYIDLMIGLVISFTVTEALAVVVLSRYHKARLDAEALAKKLGELSITDPLTGIYNRRMLTSCLDEEMRKCYDEGAPMTICLMDIDHFKKINDVHGHLCGDEVLIQLSQFLKKSMGESNISGRYGGEEFLVIFKNKTMSESLETVENFHKAIQEREWGPVNRVTISCGLCEYVNGISYSDFVRAADKRLYEAKETGRNKIVYK